MAVAEEQRAAAVALAREIGYRKAAAEFGVSTTALQAWRKKAGVSAQDDLLEY